jgi:hypothetical protein
MAPYPIVTVDPGSREDTEQLGSKPKFWVTIGNQRWLFKEARRSTGEDWAEKVAAGVAHALGTSAATVELGDYLGKRGSLSLDFIDKQAGEALVHGNEILAGTVIGYDKTKRFRQSDHTVANIQAAIRKLWPNEIADDILRCLAGYMVLDALIGNTDRHHENWGLRLRYDPTEKMLNLSVAPSFDHASSLGRELLDAKREQYLEDGSVAAYIARGRGGIFWQPADPHGANPLRLVKIAAKSDPAYFAPALERVAALDQSLVRNLVHAVPEIRASATAKRFAVEMMLAAQAQLTELLL